MDTAGEVSKSQASTVLGAILALVSFLLAKPSRIADSIAAQLAARTESVSH
jgi:hypothetical protein